MSLNRLAGGIAVYLIPWRYGSDGSSSERYAVPPRYTPSTYTHARIRAAVCWRAGDSFAHSRKYRLREVLVDVVDHLGHVGESRHELLVPRHLPNKEGGHHVITAQEEWPSYQRQQHGHDSNTTEQQRAHLERIEPLRHRLLVGPGRVELALHRRQTALHLRTYIE